MSRTKRNTKVQDNTGNPNPLNLDVFLPWACKQYELDVDVVCIQRNVPDGSKSKQARRDTKLHAVREEETERTERVAASSTYCDVQTTKDGYDENAIKIYTTYDQQNLTHIQFDKSQEIPSKLFKILALAVRYHVNLTTLTINRGLDEYGIYEINNFLPLSKITDLCLDGTNLKNPNYYTFLDSKNQVKNLSLARCGIDDNELKRIAENLSFPRPASRTLTTLNLSSNRMTDQGVAYLGEALRTNRCLIYLNLADNGLTDEGALHILNTKLEFPLSTDEVMQSRLRHFEYLKEKSSLVAKLLQNPEDKKLKKKTPRKSKTSEKDGSTMSFAGLESGLEKARALAEKMLGEFSDPYSPTVAKDGVLYSLGNNTLAYLNLTYNNLTYFTVKKLVEVLNYQKQILQKPSLVRVRIDGNFLPKYCEEYALIDMIFESALDQSVNKRKAIKTSRGK